MLAEIGGLWGKVRPELIDRYRFHKASLINRAPVLSLGSLQIGDPKPGKYNIFVETRIPWQKKARLAGFVIDLDPAKLGEWPDGPFNHDTRGKEVAQGQATPYVVQIDNGLQNAGKTWEAVYKEMKKKDEKKESGGFKTERGATLLEGMALVIAHPELLDKHRIALPGTSYGTYDIVEIHRDEKGRTVIGHMFVGDTNIDHKNPDRVFPHKRLPFSVHYSTREDLTKAA